MMLRLGTEVLVGLGVAVAVAVLVLWGVVVGVSVVDDGIEVDDGLGVRVEVDWLVADGVAVWVGVGCGVADEVGVNVGVDCDKHGSREEFLFLGLGVPATKSFVIMSVSTHPKFILFADLVAFKENAIFPSGPGVALP